MARDSCSLNLYQMVKVYQDLTIASVSSAKYFILDNLKKTQETCFVQTIRKRITQGLNAPQKHVVHVKSANNQVTPQDKRHVPT